MTDPTSPTHAGGRLANPTPHTAQYNFTAQEYTPQSDFEFTYEIEAPPVTFLPHLRGEDGYFLALVTPPAQTRKEKRDARRLARSDGKPLHLLVLADTSGSITEGQREAQLELVTALRASLGKGRFPPAGGGRYRDDLVQG